MTMTDERRVEIDRIAMTASFKSEQGDPLTETEEALLDLARYVGDVERKRDQLSQKFRIGQNAADRGERTMTLVEAEINKLAYAIRVAEGGILVGEVHAMKCIQQDLANLLAEARSEK